MKGVILCGGQSIRMGSDKGMLPLHGLNWARIISILFTRLGLSFVASVNNHQKPGYEQIFGAEKLIIDDPVLNAKGPLHGLLSLHKKLPNEDFFVIACDMIEMQLPPLQLLLHDYKHHNGFDAYLFKTETTLQPLCTIYTSDLLSKILNKLLVGDLKRFSLISLLIEANSHIIKTPLEWTDYFNNYNSPEDLSRLQKQT